MASNYYDEMQRRVQSDPNWSGAAAGTTTSQGGEGGAVFNQYAPPPPQSQPKYANESPWTGQTFTQQAQQNVGQKPTGQQSTVWSGGQEWYQAPPVASQHPGGGGAAQQVQGWYQQYFGRDASQQEINDRISQPGFNAQAHERGIAESAEGRAYAQRQGGAPGRAILPGEGYAGGGGIMAPGGNYAQQDGGYRSSGDRDADSIAQAYQQFLGRNPSAQEVQGWRGNRNAIEEIRNSAEARQRGGGRMGDPRAWNTDGYAMPGWVAQRPSGSPMPGWDATKWNDPNHQTPKYVIGRILSQYQPSIEGLRAASQEIARAYPGASFNGKDKVTIPGLDTFDLLRNSGSGQNMGWQLGAQSAAGDDDRGGGAGGYDPYSAMLAQLMGGGGGYQTQGPDPRMVAEMNAMRQQLQQFQAMQAQQQTLQQTQAAEAAAAANAQRARGPQFQYY